MNTILWHYIVIQWIALSFSLDLVEKCVIGQGIAYRGTWSRSSSFTECINWNATVLRGKKFTARKPDTRILGLGNHNYCRYSDKKKESNQIYIHVFYSNNKKINVSSEIQMETPDHGVMFIKSLKLHGNSVQCETVQQVGNTYTKTQTVGLYIHPLNQVFVVINSCANWSSLIIWCCHHSSLEDTVLSQQAHPS